MAESLKLFPHFLRKQFNVFIDRFESFGHIHNGRIIPTGSSNEEMLF
jgi:hypothetical protein